MYRFWVFYFFFISIGFTSEKGNECRWGIFKNDIHHHLKYRHEKGQNINLEWLFPPLKNYIWPYLLDPKIHLGTNINIQGYTSHTYTGLTWSFNFRNILIEPTFGVDVHSGEITKRKRKKQRLGSRFLFRESLSLGYILSSSYRVFLCVEHVSNGHFAKPNPGITTIGIRFGYAF